MNSPVSQSFYKRWLERFPRGLPALGVTLYFVMYMPVAHLTLQRSKYQPIMDWESNIPTIAEWVFIYGFVYVFAFIPIFVVRNHSLFRRCVWTFCSVFTISYLIFLLAPTMIIRPTNVPLTPFSNWALRLIWFLDPPYNCLPSLHVSTAFLSSFFCYKVHRGVGIGCIISASLITISTLFTKQHALWDLVLGFGITAFFCYFFLRGFSEAIDPEETRFAPKRAMAVVIIYLGVIAFFGALYFAGVAIPMHAKPIG